MTDHQLFLATAIAITATVAAAITATVAAAVAAAITATVATTITATVAAAITAAVATAITAAVAAAITATVATAVAAGVSIAVATSVSIAATIVAGITSAVTVGAFTIGILHASATGIGRIAGFRQRCICNLAADARPVGHDDTRLGVHDDADDLPVRFLDQDTIVNLIGFKGAGVDGGSAENLFNASDNPLQANGTT